MTQKKLQKKSVFNEYDEDGDGVVSDEELSHVKEIKETESKLRKQIAQLRMARYTLIGMGVFTADMAASGIFKRYSTGERLFQ
jgi:Ca2+-binding EF-hand superfamily protein